MKKIRLVAIAIFMLFVSNALSMLASNENISKSNNFKNKEKVIASIIYKTNYSSCLQPVVVITQPPDGAVLNDSHLVVLGYASYEFGLNYWEWKWEWEGGSYSNSSYFQTAEYVEFRIEIWGLHPGWNKITVTFCSPYGGCGSDSVNVTYISPDNQSPEVTITSPQNGSTFTQPNITVTGYITDNVGIAGFGYTQEWEGGATGSWWPLEVQPTYFPFEIEITLRGGWNRIRVTASDAAGNVGKGEVILYYPFVNISVDLTIYDGLDESGANGAGGGGQEVPESKEDTEGAFTVVNMNDSDGDGKPDYEDNDGIDAIRGIRRIGDPDLAKLKITIQDFTEDFESAYLKVSGPNKGTVKLWKNKNRTGLIEPDLNDPYCWSISMVSTTYTEDVWIEIGKMNPDDLKMQGITFTLEYKNKKDEVKLTGIWAKVTDVKHNNSDAGFPDPWGDMPSDLRNFISSDPCRLRGFGIQRYQRNINGNWVWFYGNCICIQFTVYPSGIERIERVRFDITRQMHKREEINYWDTVNRIPHPVSDEIGWPSHLEEANDDPEAEGEESINSSSNRHMYVFDAPSYTEAGWSNARFRIVFIVGRWNFMEFMRVRIDGRKPAGNRVNGSRCSDYYLWHAASFLTADPRHFGQVTRWGMEKRHLNCVCPEHLLLLDPKPPWK